MRAVFSQRYKTISDLFLILFILGVKGRTLVATIQPFPIGIELRYSYCAVVLTEAEKMIIRFWILSCNLLMVFHLTFMEGMRMKGSFFRTHEINLQIEGLLRIKAILALINFIRPQLRYICTILFKKKASKS